MNKKMSRYKGLILSCVSMMMIVVCVCSFSFESKAQETVFPSTNEFYVNYPMPSCSESQGYITLLRVLESGKRQVNTYFWTVSCVKGGLESSAQALVNLTPNSIEFNVYASNGADSVYYTLYDINAGGDYRIIKQSSTEKWFQDFAYAVEIVGWKCGGNISLTTSIWNAEDFVVYYSEDGSSALLMDILSKLSQMFVQQTSDSTQIWLRLGDILDTVDGVENQLNQVINYLKSIDDELPVIRDELQDIYDKADEILNEQKEQTNWLKKIWESIQEFLNPDEESKEESDKLQSESNDKTDKLDDLNEQNKTDKVDVDSATNSVEENVDFDSISTFSNIFVYITENEYVLQMLLLVFSVALVSYVLFGKK